MTVSVHPLDLAFESQELLDLLQVNLPALPHARRFQWLYLANPDGPAWSWVAREKGTGKVVGAASVFPRSIWVGNQLKMCGQVGDFAISASHRTLGPALSIQRATFEPVNEGKLSFCYDCPPHDAGMAPFRRLGLQRNCIVERYALPLRVDRHLRKHLGFAPPFLTAPANLLLRSYRGRRPAPKGLCISEHTGPFGDEFSEFDRAVRNSGVIRGHRSANHLNWRYREDPLQEYSVLTARSKGELVAFVVFWFTQYNMTIVDLLEREPSEASIALLEAVVQRCGPECHTVEAVLSNGNELIAPFSKSCFRRRSIAAQVVAYATPGSEMSLFLQNGARWALNGIDIRA